jgi:uncharacterized membrane protein YbhN (UPF0104 family)
MNRRAWAWARSAGVAATFGVLLWRLGTGPFLDGLGTVDARALAAAAGIAVLTTACSAWRWRLVARGLGIDLPLPVAMAAYYRSQFLNVVLPGGVLGDVDRGIGNGRANGDVGRGLRAVAWERCAGQGVQAVMTLAVLLLLPSPVRSAVPLVGLVLLAVVLAAALVMRAGRGGERSRWTRFLGAVRGDIRHGLLAGRAWMGIAAASAAATAGYALTFVVAARTAGVEAPVATLLPLALLVMLAMVLPSVAGWGPREGVTAWAFGAAGLGAGSGVATAVVFGVMLFAASLPGALVLLAGQRRRSRARQRSEPALAWRVPVAARQDGAPHG